MFKGGDIEKLRREFPPSDCKIGLACRLIPPRSDASDNGICFLTANPQVIYRPRRLVVDRSYPDLIVLDLKIGQTSQLMSGEPFPLDALLPLPPLELMYERLTHFRLGDSDDDAKKLLAANLEELGKLRNNLGRVDTCQIGQTIALVLQNTSKAPIDFKGALLYGDCMLFGDDGKALR
jgi:hypothetical protein